MHRIGPPYSLALVDAQSHLRCAMGPSGPHVFAFQRSVCTGILSSYFEILISSFHKHGGDVVSFSGDAMTVIFHEPGQGGLQRACRRCAQCSLDILAQTSNWSLKDEGLDNKLTLHAGMGAGSIRAIQVGWANEKSKAASSLRDTSAVASTGERSTGGHEEFSRCTVVIAGEPMIQLKHAEGLAGSEEAVVSKAMWVHLEGFATGTVGRAAAPCNPLPTREPRCRRGRVVWLASKAYGIRCPHMCIDAVAFCASLIGRNARVKRPRSTKDT